MTGYVITAGGQRLQLPVALNWELEYTAGVLMVYFSKIVAQRY